MRRWAVQRGGRTYRTHAVGPIDAARKVSRREGFPPGTRLSVEDRTRRLRTYRVGRSPHIIKPKGVE